jgi:hypothetical protein
MVWAVHLASDGMVNVALAASGTIVQQSLPKNCGVTAVIVLWFCVPTSDFGKVNADGSNVKLVSPDLVLGVLSLQTDEKD